MKLISNLVGACTGAVIVGSIRACLDPRARRGDRGSGLARAWKQSQAVIIGGVSLEAAPPARQDDAETASTRCHLSEFYIASSLSLNSLPLGFEKISCFVQLPDKLFDLRNRWSANLLNKWRDIRVDIEPVATGT